MEIQSQSSDETIRFMTKLDELMEKMKATFSTRTPHLNGEKYLTNQDVCKLLHISLRTLQDYRDRGRLGYIQISGKVLYKETEIIKMLEDNYSCPLSSDF
ncbi:MAG: helix-turn-helix domain-containing protein [Alistipes sp.]|nr:helix-turn-helix domain-containing protein [Alistipes sp.]